MGRMKVTMIGTLPPIKGVSDYCLEQTRELARLVDVDFISFARIYPEWLYPGGSTTEIDSVFRVEAVEGLKVSCPLKYYSPVSWVRAGLSSKGDIVHLHWWTAALAPVFLICLLPVKLRHKPVVITVHNIVGHESGFADVLASRLVLSLGDRLIVHSTRNVDRLRTVWRGDEAKVSVIPHGVYTFYRDEVVDRAAARRTLGLDTSDRVVLNLGNIRKYKGIGTLLRAFSEVARRVPRAKLVLAGECWVDWSPWQSIIRENGLTDRVVAHLHYIPSSQIKYYMSAADLVVLPYDQFDSQSGPGNIALGFGKPLVVTNVGGLPDLVRDRRQVVNAGDCWALAETIAEMLEDSSWLERASLDSQALARELSWSSIARQTVSLYQCLLDSGRATG